MRNLPSLAALRAFEAAARHLSFKSAAGELGVTPTAISHQVRALEDALGRRLFRRQVRRVELTDDGRDLAGVLTPALDDIAAAVARLTQKLDRQIVTLGAGPIFAARWLVPRLGAFWQACPGIDLRLHHSPLPVYQQLARYDLAVAWGSGDWPDMTVEPLMRIAVTPVHAPDAGFAAGPLQSARDLLALPLLHQRNRRGWRQWFEAAGAAPDGGDLPGSIIEDANVLLQAILDGQGIGLGILPFIQDDLASGRLVQPWELTVDPGEAYYLIHRARSLERQPVATVRDWLKRQIAQSPDLEVRRGS